MGNCCLYLENAKMTVLYLKLFCYKVLPLKTEIARFAIGFRLKIIRY